MLYGCNSFSSNRSQLSVSNIRFRVPVRVVSNKVKAVIGHVENVV